MTRLEPLFRYLDALSARPPLADLRKRLEDLDGLTFPEVAESAQFSNDRYMRNLIRERPHYHALLLCWRSGQRSPIHNHANSVCGLRVITGVCTETIFEHTPSGLLKAVSSRDFSPGFVAASQDGDTHQVSNLQSPGIDLVTLHIYAPPLLRMATFSLTDRTVGEFRPFIDEHIHGSGI